MGAKTHVLAGEDERFGGPFRKSANILSPRTSRTLSACENLQGERLGIALGSSASARGEQFVHLGWDRSPVLLRDP